MHHFGQQKEEKINLSFWPSTFDGVVEMSKELDLSNREVNGSKNGDILKREDLFDGTPSGDVWEWHC